MSRKRELSTSADDNLKAYFNQIKKAKLLTFEEELELSRRIQAGEEEARSRLIESNLRLVVRIAKNYLNEEEPMQKALKFILQNFHKQIQIKDLRKVTNMSTSSFCTSFKNTYRMTFKDYLLNVRIGYACKLLTDSSQNISRAAYLSGFENLSNFNRQFKKIKGITPSQFLTEVESIEQ